MNQCIRILRTITVLALAVCAVLHFAATSGAQNRWVMDDNQFNQWVYRNNGQVMDEDTEVALMVESIDRVCHLSDEQKEKLRLAGHGDYARFRMEIDELRTKYVGKDYDPNDIGKIYQEIQPFTSRYQAGLLGESSLFIKVAHRMITPSQRAEFDAAQADRRKARHAAKVRLFVALLEDRCPLKSDQRKALVELLLKETRPPLRPSEYDWYVLTVQAAKIPEPRLVAILDPAQMRYFKKVTQQAMGIEGHLKQLGVMPN
jgi:hypothetical protein